MLVMQQQSDTLDSRKDSFGDQQANISKNDLAQILARMDKMEENLTKLIQNVPKV